MSPDHKAVNVSRREFLRLLGLLSAGTALSACAPSPTPAPTAEPTKAVAPTATPTTAPSAVPATAVPTKVPATSTPAKPFAGRTVRVMMVGNPQFEQLKKMVGAYEEKTGIRVVIETYGFDVLQQRLDLELSTGSGAYDIVQMVMILIGRTIKAGWAQDLMPYVKRDNFDLKDFIPGTLNLFKEGDGLFALPWSPDVMAVVYRKDLFDKAGITKFPETFDEFMTAAAKVRTKDIAFWTCENNWHWIFPLFLQSYGGNFFAGPPGDLTPAFTTPEAIQAAELMVDSITRYGLADAANVDLPATKAAIQQGKAAVGMSGLGVVQAAADPTASTVTDKIRFAHVPKGPKGWFPQLGMHGYMIPSASKQKDAAWEVMKWLTSYEAELAALNEIGQVARNRYSILRDPKVKDKYTWGGTDVAKILEEALDRAGAGYMAYRIVPPFRVVGARVNVAFGEMLSGQKKVKQAMADLQKDAVDILTQAGYPPKK